jgi:hypothetical protein
MYQHVVDCGCAPQHHCAKPACCEPVSLPIINSHNHHTTVHHNYMPRPVAYGCDHGRGYYAAVAPVTYRRCGCAPQTNCSCESSYGESSDCGSGCGSAGSNSTTGNVPANASVAPYILASKLAPGKYMVTGADNVAGGTLFVGTIDTPKTIGTEFTITVPTDVFFNVTTVSGLPTSLRFTKI